MSSSWAADLRASLALDLRSLALMRAMLAAYLLADALCGLRGAGLLYADGGLLPRADAMAIMGPAQLSLHLLNGSTAFALLLGLIQVAAAAALLLGWSARRATLVSWLLLVSTAARNPLVLDAADGLAIALLFLGLFLPWNARWSVDAAWGRANAPPVAQFFSRTGLALLAQVLLLPLLAGLAQGGSVVEARSWTGAVLLSLQVLCLPLGLLPGLGAWPRRVALILFLLSGVVTSVASGAGLPVWLALCAAAALIDTGIWARLAPAPAGGELRLYVPDEAHAARRLALLLCEFLCLPRAAVIAARESPRAARLMPAGGALVVIDRADAAHMDGAGLMVLLAHSPLLRPLRVVLTRPRAGGFGARLFALLLCCLPKTVAPERRATSAVAPRQRRSVETAVLALALASITWQLCRLGAMPATLGEILRAPLSAVGLDLAWTAAAPPSARWIVTPAETLDGMEIDARARGARPANFGPVQVPFVPGKRGEAYERSLMAPGASLAREALARRLCARREPALARVRIVQVSRAAPGDEATTEQHVLLRRDCR